MIRFLSDLGGTLRNFFRIGTTGLKNESGEIVARNKDDDVDVAMIARSFKVRDPTTANVVTITVPDNHLTGGNLTINLPPDSGSTDQALLTDGDGNLSWGSVATGENALKSDEEVITPASGATTAMFIPPEGALIHRVKVSVEGAFDGTPTLTVGVSSTAARYMQATQNELGEIDTIWEVMPLYKDSAPLPADREVQVAFDGGGATVGSARVVVVYSNPG